MAHRLLNYTTQAGTIREDFENTSNFSYVQASAGGGIANDTTVKKSGSQSVLFTAPASGNVFCDRDISLNLSGDSLFGLWIYVPSLANISSVGLYIASSISYATFFNASLDVSKMKVGWNFWKLHQDDFTNNGGESWANTMVKFRFRLNALGTGTCSLNMDSLISGFYTRPKLLFTMDDGFDSAYSQGASYLTNKGLRGTFYINSSFINQAGRLTDGQLLIMNAQGHDLANHTTDHTDLTTLSDQPSLLAKIQPSRDYLEGKGFTRASRHFAYPYGHYDANTTQALSTVGTVTARTTNPNTENTFQVVDDFYALNCRDLQNTVTLATAEGYIDSAIKYGDTLLFLNHELVTTPGSATQWAITDWQALIDYATTKLSQIDVVTISQWYEGLTNTTPAETVGQLMREELQRSTGTSTTSLDDLQEVFYGSGVSIPDSIRAYLIAQTGLTGAYHTRDLWRQFFLQQGVPYQVSLEDMGKVFFQTIGFA